MRDAGDDGGDDDELYGDLYAEGGGEAVGVLTLQTAEVSGRGRGGGRLFQRTRAL